LKYETANIIFALHKRESSQTLCDGTEQALAQSMFALYSTTPPPSDLSTLFHLPSIFVVFGLWPYPGA